MFNPMSKIQDSRRSKASAAASAASIEGTTLGKNERFLLHNFSGVLKSGEMALVIGRPGSGCTTFLKVSFPSAFVYEQRWLTRIVGSCIINRRSRISALDLRGLTATSRTAP